MQVRIYNPTKSAMQSGKNKNKWVLEFVLDNTDRFIDESLARK